MTIESTIADDAIAQFYALYSTAFDGMRQRAAARHLLTMTEFAVEMADTRIEKYVVWADDGQPIGLTTLTNDLSAVTWISADFYTARYPEHAARGALFYLGYTLVHPEHSRHGAITMMFDRVLQRMAEARGVCLFDVSAHNDRRGLGRFVAAVPRSYNAVVEPVDTQTYYGITFGEPSAANTPKDQTEEGLADDRGHGVS